MVSTSWSAGGNSGTAYYCLCDDSFDELHKPACILVRLDGGYLCTGAVLNRLRRLRCPFLDAVVGQDIDECHEVDFLVQTFCAELQTNKDICNIGGNIYN